jgi:hypothetical protein
MLHSPSACSRPTSFYKALPSPPRSIFLSSPDLPAELPGSILQDNHGFPTCAVAEDLAIGCAASSISPSGVQHLFRRSTDSPNRDVDFEDNFSTLITLFPEPSIHSKSVPDLGQQFREMRSVRSSTALSSTSVSRPSQLGSQHNKPLSAISSQRSSKTARVKSPTSADGKLTVHSTLTVAHDSATARTPTDQTLQPESLNPEFQVWNGNAEFPDIRREEVSTICFQDVICLFVKQNTTHNETVSELLSFLCPAMIRHTVPEINVHVNNSHGCGFCSFRTVVVVWRHETRCME